MPSQPVTVDDYIKGHPPDVQKKLQALRKALHTAVPGAKEVISYQIACLKKNGPVIYFAAHSKHIATYPLPKGDEKWFEQFKPYVAGKGTLRFDLKNPLPIPLIQKVARHLAKADANRGGANTSEFPKLGQPALRALDAAGLTTLKRVASWSEPRVWELHGMGPKAMQALKAAMKENGLQFAKK